MEGIVPEGTRKDDLLGMAADCIGNSVGGIGMVGRDCIRMETDFIAVKHVIGRDFVRPVIGPLG